MPWRIKSCPHCGGDTFLDKDMTDAWVENCLQCGYDAVLKQVDIIPQEVKLVEKLDIRQATRSRGLTIAVARGYPVSPPG